MIDAVPVPGEVLAVPERVIVAPAVGVFRPLRDTDDDATAAGELIVPARPSASSRGPAPRRPSAAPSGASSSGCWPTAASGSGRASRSPGSALA